MDFDTDVDKDDGVGCSVSGEHHGTAMSSPFAPDPVRYDNTAHEDWPRQPPGKALSKTLDFDRTHGYSKSPLSAGGLRKLSLSLSLSLSPVTI